MNSALAMNRIEPVYGLSNSEQLQFVGGNSGDQTGANSAQQGATSSSKQNNRKLVNLGIESGVVLFIASVPAVTVSVIFSY